MSISKILEYIAEAEKLLSEFKAVVGAVEAADPKVKAFIEHIEARLIPAVKAHAAAVAVEP